MPGSDRYFDLTLRILTLGVLAALLGCVAFLMHRWSQPGAPESSLVQVVQAPTPAVAVPLPAPSEAAVRVLHAPPGRIFRCDNQGQVTFSDQPCRDANAR
jgi:hypothetical protein